MRKCTQSCSKLNNKQQGFSLFMVLVMMVLIALAVVAGVRWTSTETRSSANSADRQVALSVAEAAIRDAETKLVDKVSEDNFDKTKVFKAKCDKDGFCLPGSSPYWEDKASFTKDNSAEYTAGAVGVSQAPRYVVEYMGGDGKAENANTYRITARAWGKNANTQVTIQVYDQIQ